MDHTVHGATDAANAANTVHAVDANGDRRAVAPVPAPLEGQRQLAPTFVRWLWLILAYASLGMGLIAIFIPGIPTTEFILLSAWAASKGSPRLQRWLENHPVFGAMIYNWRHGRVVARRAKISASLMMSLCLIIMLFTVRQRWIIALAALGMAAGAMWMWSRPERVENEPAGAERSGDGR